MPPLTTFIQAKIKAARRGTRRPEDFEDGRVPRGQRVVDHFPVLDLGARPKIKAAEWRLELSGTLEAPLTLTWDELLALPQTEVIVDIHCVTHWTRLDVPWVGVRLREILKRARPLPQASHVVLHGADNYTTNLPLSDLLGDDVLLAHRVDGRPLPTEHGGPVRLLVPQRYFWKSAKWITGISVHTEDQPGFWETRGYHNAADPWKEERYARKY